MSKKKNKLRNLIQTRSLSKLTKALYEMADLPGYQLQPPYTEIKQFRAHEEEDRYPIQFQGTLNLSYKKLERPKGDAIFCVDFSGEAISDPPNPPIHELLYAGSMTSLTIFGYGNQWWSEMVEFKSELLTGLEVSASALKKLSLDSLLAIFNEKYSS